MVAARGLPSSSATDKSLRAGAAAGDRQRHRPNLSVVGVGSATTADVRSSARPLDLRQGRAPVPTAAVACVSDRGRCVDRLSLLTGATAAVAHTRGRESVTHDHGGLVLAAALALSPSCVGLHSRHPSVDAQPAAERLALSTLTHRQASLVGVTLSPTSRALARLSARPSSARLGRAPAPTAAWLGASVPTAADECVHSSSSGQADSATGRRLR